MGKLAWRTKGHDFSAHGQDFSYSRVGSDQDMKVASMTVDMEDMDRNMNGPETMAAEAKVVMTTNQEKIAETIMTTEMKRAHLMYINKE